MSRLRRHLSYANVMATIAVFLALGGTSYAALVITSKNVKNNSLTSADIKNESLLSKDFKPGQLVAGALGPRGATGDTGAPGAKGTAGDTGGPGAKGTTGDTGGPGAAGAPGAKGDIGDPGKEGEPGTSGATTARTFAVRHQVVDRGSMFPPPVYVLAVQEGDLSLVVSCDTSSGVRYRFRTLSDNARISLAPAGAPILNDDFDVGEDLAPPSSYYGAESPVFVLYQGADDDVVSMTLRIFYERGVCHASGSFVHS